MVEPRPWRSSTISSRSRPCCEVLDGRVLPEVGKLEPRDEPLAFAFDGLAIDQEAEPLLERERSNSGLLSLLLERLGHAEETEGDEPVGKAAWLKEQDGPRLDGASHASR
jgi:hypothetical protein